MTKLLIASFIAAFLVAPVAVASQEGSTPPQPPKSWVAVVGKETALEQLFCQEDGRGGVLVRLTDGNLACISLQAWEGMNNGLE